MEKCNRPGTFIYPFFGKFGSLVAFPTMWLQCLTHFAVATGAGIGEPLPWNGPALLARHSSIGCLAGAGFTAGIIACERANEATKF